MARTGRPGNTWMPPETKRLLDERYQGNMHSLCREHEIAHQSIKDLYNKRPAAVHNIVALLTGLGFDESDGAMRILKEMSGQTLTQVRKIDTHSEQKSKFKSIELIRCCSKTESPVSMTAVLRAA